MAQRTVPEDSSHCAGYFSIVALNKFAAGQHRHDVPAKLSFLLGLVSRENVEAALDRQMGGEWYGNYRPLEELLDSRLGARLQPLAEKACSYKKFHFSLLKDSAVFDRQEGDVRRRGV
ncbi:hypothetical protein [Sinorhizobium meliloti]|uniref:hypothetical protein n=1 Tax=Rhizobium meliloti TaxID=382 RepID=UPI000FE069E5|nr:hypothetical protein [Sinorhizobium meliloti]RVQ53564.1 hypothetical protein CN245_22180 [Sinorhizobium meliloti]